MPKNIYNEIISKDNLLRAWDHVRYDAIDDFAPDVFGYDDVGANINELIKIIHNGLSSHDYQAYPLKHIDVPKSTLAVRPGSVPEIEDRIVSYAILNVIAPEIDKRISDNVYSYRLKKNYKKSKTGLFESRRDIPFLKKDTIRKTIPFEHWSYAWPAFYETSKRLYEESDYNFLTISDVSAYFENINHELLKCQLFELLNEQKIINLLMGILDRWVWTSVTLHRVGRGIPQGNDLSNFLGNIYLMPLDQKLEEYSNNHDIKYIRYMDDTMIFSKSKNVAIEVLFLMNTILRDLCLNIQGKKNQILEGKDIERELFPEGMDELNNKIERINDYLKKKKLDSKTKIMFETEIKQHFRTLPRKNLKKNDRRLFSRSLTGFKMIRSRAPVNRCLIEITKNPDAGLNNKIISYLKIFPNIKPIKDGVKSFLLLDIKKFEYQEAHLILLNRYLSEISTELIDYMYKISLDQDKNWFLRTAALITIGSTKIEKDKLIKLRALYDSETNTDVKRAIALCLVQLDKANLLAFIKQLRGELENHLTNVGNYYDKLISDRGNLAQKSISMMKDKHPETDFYKEHFYLFYLISKVDKSSIKGDLATLLKKNHREIKGGKFQNQIKYLYKEITTVDL